MKILIQIINTSLFVSILIACDINSHDDSQLKMMTPTCNSLRSSLQCVRGTGPCSSLPNFPTEIWVKIITFADLSDSRLFQLFAVNKKFNDPVFEIIKTRLEKQISPSEFRAVLGQSPQQNSVLNHYRALMKAWRSADVPVDVEVQTLPNHLDNVIFSDSHFKKIDFWELNERIAIWDTQTGTVTRTLDDVDWIMNAAIEPEHSKILISLNGQDTLKKWDLEQGTTLKSLQLDEGEMVESFIIDPKNQDHIITFSFNGQIKTWSFESGRKLKTLGTDQGRLGIHLDPFDSNRLIEWNQNGSLRFWNLTDGTLKQTIQAHSQRIGGVTFKDKNPSTLISWSHDGIIRLWNLDGGTEIGALQGHQGPISGVKIFADQKRLLSWGHDRTIKVWDLETKTLLKNIVSVDPNDFFTDVLLHPFDAHRVIAVMLSGEIRIMDLEREQIIKSLNLPNQNGVRIKGAVLDPNSSRLVIWDIEKNIKIWNFWNTAKNLMNP